MFPDRYLLYDRDFEKLRDGTIGVRESWRLYSSGPGIYLHQLVSNILGIRFLGGSLIVDPVLPPRSGCKNAIKFCLLRSRRT